MSTTGNGKAFDRAMSYNHSFQETVGCSVLATLTKGGGITTLHQNGFQAVDMGG